MGAVAVVGGGLAGLTAAFRLKQQGARVVVYEADDRVGGVVVTERRDGYLADLGPNTMAAPAPALHALLDELELTSALVPASPVARTRYIVKKKRLLPLPMSPQAVAPGGWWPARHGESACRETSLAATGSLAQKRGSALKLPPPSIPQT